MVSDNKSLGRFNLSGIEAAPKGTPQIEVSFSIDANGILKVSAKDKKTNKENTITIENNTSLSEEEIEKMIKDAEENREADNKKKDIVETKVRAESLVNQLEVAIKDQGDKMDAKQKEETEKQIKEINKLLEKEETEKLKIKLDEIDKLMQAAAQQNAGPQPKTDDDGTVEAEVKEK